MLNLENTYTNKNKDVQYQTSSNFYTHKDKDLLKESVNVQSDDIQQVNKKENVFSKTKNNFHNNKIESNISAEHLENDEKIEDPHAPKM